ncbi:MAG TPA: hypothetical protein VMH87_18190 [Pseudomonadales bacterium]|nr:hypothetical protein [Pseudomonadales bacterium]
MRAPPKLPLTSDQAWGYTLLNVSIPGWGSWKAGRKFTGFGEMFILIACLFLFGMWFFQYMNRVFQSELGEDALPPVPPNWLWQWGIVLYVVSVVWTVVTSVSMVREAKAHEAEVRRNTPPKLADLPKPPIL